MQALGTLQHKEIIGQEQSEKAGFGLVDSWKAWRKATLPEGGRWYPVLFTSKKRKLDSSCLSGIAGAMEELA